MAIAQDPLKISQSIDTSQSDFNSMSEDTIKNNAAAAANIGANSVFNGGNGLTNAKLTIPTVAPINTSYTNSSIFTDILCCKLPSVLQRMDLYLGSLGNWRNLNFDFNYMLNICDNKKKNTPLDVVLGASSFIASNPGIFSPNSDERISALLRSDFVRKLDILGLGNTIPMCILYATKNNVYGSSGYVGPSLSARNKLRDLLAQNSCTALLSNQPLVSSWLSNSVAANMISVLLAGNEAKAYDYIDLSLGIAGQRQSALSGLAWSFNNAYNYNTRQKFTLLNTYVSSGRLQSSDYVYLRADSTKVLETLDNDTKENPNSSNSNNPSKDLDNILSGLDVLDPTWNKDEDGGDNYTKAANNKTISDLTDNTLKSKYSKSLNLTGDYTTVLTPELQIAVIKASPKQTLDEFMDNVA